MAHLALFLLGPFQATLDGAAVTTFESDKVRALLAYLAVERDRPQRRETLAGLLWPDMAERDARTNLRHVLANLRQALNDRDTALPFLLPSRQTIQFNIESDYRLDVQTFTDAVALTTVHPHANVENCEACLARLEEAAALYQGDFLAGFSLDSDLFEGWVTTQREKLHIQALDVLHHLAAHHEQRGDHSAVIRYAQRQVELEPWRESAHRQWMQALACSGQRGMALVQYEACCQVLGEELGIGPEPATQALYQRIRDREELCSALPTISYNLPAALIPFVGRRKLLGEIQSRLVDPACRLLTLVGPGGSGKTRLALEAARKFISGESEKHFPDGVYFVPLAALNSSEDIVPAFAEAMDFSFYGEGEPKTQLLNYIRRKRMLLILDNFEHLVTDVTLVVDVLRVASDIKVLVTSRTKLDLPAEQLIPVEGMAYPGSFTALSFVLKHSAVRLFIQSVRRVQPDFALNVTNVADVLHICQYVYGMPLGILLAAAWADMLTPSEIAFEIERGLDFLTVDWRTVPERQRSMRAVFDHSWRLLGERERGVLSALSVFQGGCTSEMAQVVANASLCDLHSLFNRSLLHRAPGGRYEMHELLRQYALEQLEQQPNNKRRAQERHSAIFVQALACWEIELKGPRQQIALSEIASDLENVRVAIEWMLANTDVRGLEHALESLGLFFKIYYRYQQGVSLCHMIAETSKTFLSGQGRRLRAIALAWESHFLEQMGDVKLAESLIRESLYSLGFSGLDDEKIYASVQNLSEADQRAHAFVLWVAGMAMWHKDFTRAEQLFERSLELYQILGARWYIARLLHTLGLIGEAGKAISRCRKSVVMFQALGDPRMLTDGLIDLGRILLNQGEVDEGEMLVRQAIDTAEANGTHLDIAVHYILHTISFFNGKFAQARAARVQHIARYEALGAQMRIAESTLFLSYCDTHLGIYERAGHLAGTCLTQCHTRGYVHQSAKCYEQLGLIALAYEHYEQAQQWIKQSDAIFRKSGVQRMLSTLVGLGYVTCGLGKRRIAKQHFYQALESIIHQHNWWMLLYALPGVARLLSDLEYVECAVELYGFLSQYPYIGNSQWFEDVAGKYVASTATALPAEVVTAAQAHGCAHDMWKMTKELLTELETGKYDE